MQITPDVLEQEFSLPTAATRLDFLSRRDDGATSLDTVAEPAEDHWSSLTAVGTSLDVEESLELLALGEVVSRKAHDTASWSACGPRFAAGRAGRRSPTPWGSPPSRPGTPSTSSSTSPAWMPTTPRAPGSSPVAAPAADRDQRTSTPRQNATRPVISFAASLGSG